MPPEQHPTPASSRLRPSPANVSSAPPAASATPPEGLAARVLELGEELRREGVAVGTSELLDAFAVLREVPWTEQEDFREALAATLAKSQEDRRVFELVFDRFFFRAVELAALREDVREGDPSQAPPGAIDLDELSEEDLEALRARIAAALRDGSEAAMADLARMAIAAFGRREEGSGVIGVDVQRIRRALGLRTEPQPDLPVEDPRREGLPRDALRRFEALLRRELERGQIERTGSLPPGRWPTWRPCTAWYSSCAAAWPRRGCRRAGTAATHTSTCAVRCARRCRPAAFPSC
jgi:uncharacterized protein with von Willebrand factor type A (vWA) domain